MQKKTDTTVMFPRKEPASSTMVKRIGSTIFTINVHFSEASTETLEDKITRLIDMGTQVPGGTGRVGRNLSQRLKPMRSLASASKTAAAWGGIICVSGFTVSFFMKKASD